MGPHPPISPTPSAVWRDASTDPGRLWHSPCRDIGRLLTPGGVLLLVTTAVTPDLFSRHVDLLLRAQEGAMELPEAEQLGTQLAEAGLRPEPPQRIAPGVPIIAVAATRT